MTKETNKFLDDYNEAKSSRGITALAKIALLGARPCGSFDRNLVGVITEDNPPADKITCGGILCVKYGAYAMIAKTLYDAIYQ